MNRLPAFGVLLFFLSTSSLFSQSFSLTYGTLNQTMTLNCFNSEIILNIGENVKNETNQPLHLRVKTLRSYLPSSWNAICTPSGAHRISGCFNNVNEPITVPANGELSFGWVLFIPVQNFPTDTAYVDFEIYDENDPINSRDTIRHTATIVNPFEMQPLIRIPQPVHHQVQTKYPSTPAIFMYNMRPEINSFSRNLPLQWRKIKEVIPPDWDYDCSMTGLINSCSAQSGSFLYNCEHPPMLNASIKVTSMGNSLARWSMSMYFIILRTVLIQLLHIPLLQRFVPSNPNKKLLNTQALQLYARGRKSRSPLNPVIPITNGATGKPMPL